MHPPDVFGEEARAARHPHDENEGDIGRHSAPWELLTISKDGDPFLKAFDCQVQEELPSFGGGESAERSLVVVTFDLGLKLVETGEKAEIPLEGRDVGL